MSACEVYIYGSDGLCLGPEPYKSNGFGPSAVLNDLVAAAYKDAGMPNPDDPTMAVVASGAVERVFVRVPTKFLYQPMEGPHGWFEVSDTAMAQASQLVVQTAMATIEPDLWDQLPCTSTLLEAANYCSGNTERCRRVKHILFAFDDRTDLAKVTAAIQARERYLQRQAG